jgi:SAM-dependent methyltransferase
MNDTTLIELEATRIREEYKRRERELDPDLYAPWQPGEILMITERERVAATLLRRFNKFPAAGDRCLELGYGKLGWLGRLISWGVRESDLYGIELDQERASMAMSTLPKANLIVGNAVDLPWQDNLFQLVVVSTLFSSILDANVRQSIAEEMDRVLIPGGVVLWYDAAVNNPKNKNLKGLSRSDIKGLFPSYEHHLRTVTLVPPMARWSANVSWTIATALSAIPFFRTHLVGVLIKQ